jgi:formylglycine-generating enzyme required for sulfatase activity
MLRFLVCVLLFLSASCRNEATFLHEDDCFYCDKDISGGISSEADVPAIPKEQDITVPDEAVIDEPASDADLIPAENMVLIEGASFMMGCEEGVAPACNETNALPHHQVIVPGFEIDVYEVTKKEYEACITAGACVNDPDNGIIHYSTSDEKAFCVLDSTLGDGYPVNCISWEGARAYCAWLGKRLPTEAEWELAARGTDGRWYPWGKEPTPSCDNVVMDDGSGSPTSWGCGNDSPMPVGSKPVGASPYGLYDMAGSMWEWVEDDWHATYDDAEIEDKRPDDGSAWIDTPRTAYRVIRGGSFMIGIEDFFEFTTYAHYGNPAESTDISRGFRCAR